MLRCGVVKTDCEPFGDWARSVEFDISELDTAKRFVGIVSLYYIYPKRFPELNNPVLQEALLKEIYYYSNEWFETIMYSACKAVDALNEKATKF